MKELNIEINRLGNLLKSRVNEQLWKNLKTTQITDIPEMVYTSFESRSRLGILSDKSLSGQ